MARRRRRTSAPGPYAGSVLFSGSGSRPSGRRRGGGPRRPWGAILAVLVLLAAAAAAAVLIVRHETKDDGSGARRAAAQRFVAAWADRDTGAMWRTLSPAARRAHPRAAFAGAYKSAETAAGVTAVHVGTPVKERAGTIAVRVAVTTKVFGTLRGVVALPVSGIGPEAGVDWASSLRLPGLRAGEGVKRRDGAQPTRATIFAADGSPLDATGLGASIAGKAGAEPTGLERIYDERLAGHPSERLLFGARTVGKVDAVRGRSVRTTIRPGLMATAANALGSKLGGIAVVRPRDGAVLALAGLAVSAPQPPGSTFKIITASAALDRGIATPSSTYPVRTFATLSGVKLRNASGESCGGTLTAAFIDSCNSVFAPLGAKLGGKRLRDVARKFGFDETLKIPALKASTLGGAGDLADDIAVGSAAIGQNRDLATPLAMASVGATIAYDGRRARPRIATLEPVVRHRVVPAKVAHQVREMMLGVVRSGTGTAAAIPGVQVAGKTGTAELKANSKRKEDADAWFVAFAPAGDPQVAVAVMLVGAGFGGTSAAPIAKQVLSAALGR